MSVKPRIILSSKAMEPLMQKIILCSFGLKRGEIEWRNFADGWPNILVRDRAELEGLEVIFLASFNAPADVFRQLSVIYALPKFDIASLDIVLPFFPTGTMDRDKNDPGEIVTAKTLARMISVTPPCCKIRLTMFDLHSLPEKHFFGDNIVIRTPASAEVIKDRMKAEKDLVIVFPDKGAQERYALQFPVRSASNRNGYDHVLCDKVRNADKRVVTIKEGDVNGKVALIVDDQIQTGGTMIECAKAVRAAGAKSVMAYSAHAVLPQESWKLFTPELFDKVLVSDSCPDSVESIKNLSHFEVLSLAPLIVKSLRLPTTQPAKS
jgi:ribose-phosphate pyrophosphokinase